MLVNNYFIYRGKADQQITYATNEYTNPGLKRYSDGSTSWQPLWANNNTSYTAYASQNSALHLNNFVVIGTGDTAESLSDYRLANDITGSISNYQQSYTSGEDGNTLKTTFSISGVNNTGSAITIKEVGIGKNILDGNIASVPVMFLRKVLDTPIEVANGSTFAFSVEWKESEPETVSATRSVSETRGETKSGSQEEPKEEVKESPSEPISEPLEKKVDESPKEEEEPEIEDEKEPVEEPEEVEEEEDEVKK